MRKKEQIIERHTDFIVKKTKLFVNIQPEVFWRLKLPMLIKLFHLFFTGLSLGLFYLSLANPVFHVRNSSEVLGIQLLIEGWCGLFLGNFGWLANLFYGTALTLSFIGRKNIALPIAILGIFLAFDGFRISEYYIAYDKIYTVTARGLGFYYWLTSICLLPVSILFSRKLIT